MELYTIAVNIFLDNLQPRDIDNNIQSILFINWKQ